jgi:hemolysin activation/secretion protein
MEAPATAPVEAQDPPVMDPPVTETAPATAPVDLDEVEMEAPVEQAPPPVRIEFSEEGLPIAPPDETQFIELPYAIDQLDYRYIAEHPGHPPVAEFDDVEVDMVLTTSGFIAPRDGLPITRIRLGDIPNLSVQDFHLSALLTLLQGMVSHLQSKDLFGVYVYPDPGQIVPGTGEDVRDIEGGDAMTFLIVTGLVREMRTLAFGDRLPDEERENNAVHARILANSPLKTWSGEGPRNDLLRRRELDDYLARLNRLPGRRVDAAVSAAGDEQGGVVLDFLVAENQPWMFYTQVSNTGTAQTDRVRERFGLIRNQLTDNDDVLSIEYVTATFDESNAVIGAYEAPVGESDNLRWQINGSWSEFTASDVGIADEDFSGDSWSVGGEVSMNIYQYKELFIDMFAGARFMNVNVQNDFVSIEGDTDFFLAQVGFRAKRRTNIAVTDAMVMAEFSLPDVADTDEDELNNLGRLFPDDDWTILRWNLSQTIHLEPLLNREAWEDINTRESSTLAHEMKFVFRGQHAFDNRLIPQAEETIGGLYSIRGYPESVVAGDDAMVASVEYMLHLPKSQAYQDEPGEFWGKDFRWVPQEPYGAADWDLIFRSFFDIGRVEISEPFSFEDDETLMSAGIGVELSFYRNINLRLDWGIVLEELENQDVNKNSNRAHFVATFIF